MPLKSKEKVLSEKLGLINESVIKMGDLFKVKTVIDIPRSLINGFVSKAKKENGIDARETWSDIDIAEMLVEYIKATYLNIDSLPVTNILGEPTKTPGDVQDTFDEPEMAQSQAQEDPMQSVQTDVQNDVQNTSPQPLDAQTQVQVQDEPVQ